MKRLLRTRCHKLGILIVIFVASPLRGCNKILMICLTITSKLQKHRLLLRMMKCMNLIMVKRKKQSKITDRSDAQPCQPCKGTFMTSHHLRSLEFLEVKLSRPCTTTRKAILTIQSNWLTIKTVSILRIVRVVQSSKLTIFHIFKFQILTVSNNLIVFLFPGILVRLTENAPTYSLKSKKVGKKTKCTWTSQRHARHLSVTFCLTN